MALSPSREGQEGDKGLSQTQGDVAGGCHPSSSSVPLGGRAAVAPPQGGVR